MASRSGMGKVSIWFYRAKTEHPDLLYGNTKVCPFNHLIHPCGFVPMVIALHTYPRGHVSDHGLGNNAK